MTNEELIELRKMLGKYTEYLLANIQNPEAIKIDPVATRIGLINYVDKANRVAFDVETLIVVD